MPLPPTHKSEHLTQHVKDSCFQQPFPPFVSLSKVPRNFTLFEKLRTCTLFLFCPHGGLSADFRRISTTQTANPKKTPGMELDPFRCTHRVKSFVRSALCIASPVPWSLPDFPLTNRFVPSRDSPFLRNGEKWRLDPFWSFFLMAVVLAEKDFCFPFGVHRFFFLGMECRKVGQNSDVSICCTFLRLLVQKFAKLLF